MTAWPLTGVNWPLFLIAALVLAAIPGPGILYVAARTAAGGRWAGLASALGTAIGGLIHVVAGAVGISAILLASAHLFTAMKIVGAICLIWLGIGTIREASQPALTHEVPAPIGHAFRDGILVEALNPKTAAFFLAFIPQFIDSAAPYPALQFLTLGLISLSLNGASDAVVVALVATTRKQFQARPALLQRFKQGSGLFIAGLGVSLALARRAITND